jgi:hypothetical protein
MAEAAAKQAVMDYYHEHEDAPPMNFYSEVYDKAYRQILAELNGLIPS